jgi:uncharacterized protein YybS (DUF2232 family)
VTPRQGTTRIVLTGVSLGLFLVALETGVGRTGPGALTGLVSFVPVALALVLGGPAAGGLAGLTAVLGAAAVAGVGAATALGARHAVPGLVLGVALARRLPIALSLILVGSTSVAALLALVWAYAPAGLGILAFLQQALEAQTAELERLAARLGPAGGGSVVAESARLAAGLMQVAGPAVIVVSLGLMALVNYAVARLCLRGRGFRPFAEEAVPDHLVWGVVAGGVCLASGQELLVRVGLNLLLVLVPLYAIQGLAVLRHFFQKARLPRPLQGVGFGLFALQPLLLVAVACLGLSDLWADFRKIRGAPTAA